MTQELPRAAATLWTAARILFVWLGIYGWGRMAGKALNAGPLSRMPSVILGFILSFVYVQALSLAGLLGWPAILPYILSGSAATIYFLRKAAWRRGLKAGSTSMTLIFGTLAVILLISNVFRASRPNTNPDPLTTYAVQPDRWLERGQIFFLEETRFSAFPVLGERI